MMASVLRKHWRLISLVLGVIIVLWILYLLRMAVLPFLLGLVFAYLFLPVTSWVEKKLPRQGRWTGFKRVFTILLLFIVLLALFGFFAYYVVTVVIDASMILLENAPNIITKSADSIQQWLEGLRLQFAPEIWEEVEKAIANAGKAIGESIQNALVKGIISVPNTFSVVLGFAALPFFLFYIMKDSERLKRGFYSAFTPWTAEHLKNILSIIERVLGRYIRAQLMLSLIVAYLVFVGLLILGIQYAPVLAMVAGITELIPTLGPWIGGAVAVIVTLAIAPDKAIWVAILFVSVQMLENYFLVPRVQSAYLRIHPAVMIFLLVLGAYIAGFWGLLLAAPLTATVVAIYKYVYQQYQQTENADQQAEMAEEPPQ